MPLVVAGLGNPGDRYAKTRHNVGWMLVDRLAKLFDISLAGTRFPGDARGEVGRGKVLGEQLLLVKPHTFMNLSGDFLVPLLMSEGLGPTQLLIAVDEVQVPVGRIKMVFGGSSGGQNGTQSVIERLGSSGFYRCKFGIGLGRQGGQGRQVLKDFVLSEFHDDEHHLLDQTLDLACESLKQWASYGFSQDGFGKVITQANAKPNQPLDRLIRAEAEALKALAEAEEPDETREQEKNHDSPNPKGGDESDEQ